MTLEEKYITVEEFTGSPLETDDLYELLSQAKIPADLKVTKRLYDENDCARVILPNLPLPIQKKLSIQSLTTLLNFQADYMNNSNENYFLDEENINYLTQKCQLNHIPLDNQEIETIFEWELVYLYLIDAI